MTAKQPFNPKRSSTQAVTAGAAALIITIEDSANQVRIVNTGSNKAYVMCYGSDEVPVPVATAIEHCVPPGMASTITKSKVHNRLSYISALGTTLEISTGEGF
ncbi:MAG: hypothetical protein V4631_22120 [Pseudomonadota bacterium]